MQTVVQVGSALWPFILAGAVAALMLFRKNGDRAKRARIYMPLLAGTLACAALALVFSAATAFCGHVILYVSLYSVPLSTIWF